MYNLTNNAIKALGTTYGGLIIWKAWEEGGRKYLSITDNRPGAAESAFRALYDDSVPVMQWFGLTYCKGFKQNDWL